MVKLQRFGEWCEIEVPAHWEGYSIEYIVRALWGAPKKQTHNMRMKKQVLSNDEPANWTKPVHAGDKLKFQFFEDEIQALSHHIMRLMFFLKMTICLF